MRTHVKDTFDVLLTADDFIQNPYPTFDRLRAEAPVYWSEAWNCWVVTSYDDVERTIRDFHHFSNHSRYNGIFEAIPDDQRQEFAPLEAHYTSVGLIHSDPPDHTRLRKLIHLAFTPKVIREMRDRIQAIVDQHLDAVQAAGRMDVVHDLAFPLPATVIAIMLGVPPDDIERLKQWTTDSLMFQATGRATPDVLRISQRALMEMRAYLKLLADDRRRAPQADLITALVAAEDEGDRLTEDELLSTCVTLMVAGHETTTNLIANGTYLMLKHPEVLADLREHPERMPGAVEEFLRLESPIQRNRRVIAVDFEYDGIQMKRGQAMLQMLGAANRDPAQFPDAADIDIQRNPNPHLAFGLGIHFCLGAPLARLEAPIALNTLLERMPNIRLAADQLEWLPGVMRNLRALPVTF